MVCGVHHMGGSWLQHRWFGSTYNTACLGYTGSGMLEVARVVVSMEDDIPPNTRSLATNKA